MNYDNQKNFYSDPPKKKRPVGKPPKKRRSVLSVLLTITLALIALLLAIITAGYFTITHRPSGYQPRQWSADPKVRQEEQSLVNHWADKKVQELNRATQDGAQTGQSFVYRIEQKELNDLLLTDFIQKNMKWKWPNFSQKFRRVQFSFFEKKVKVMGEANYKGVESVLTIAFVLKLTDNNNLHITLDSVDIGALPVPKAVIHEQLDRIVEVLKKKRNPREEKKKQTQETENVEELVELLADLLRELIDKRNMAVPAEFPVDVDKKARILALEIGDGFIDLTLKSFWTED